MNVNIGTEAAQFPEKEYINGIFVAVLNFVVAHLLIFRAFYTLPVLETNHWGCCNFHLLYREQGSCSDWETVEAQKLFQVKINIKPTTVHCKKSWRSSSTPASGDAGPKHTGVEQSFRHPWRKFYYKYRTFPTFFTSVELVRQSRKVSKAACGARTYDLQDYNLPLYHCATLSSLFKCTLKDIKGAEELYLCSSALS